MTDHNHQIGDQVRYHRTKYSPAETVTIVGLRGNGGVTIGWMDGGNITKRHNLSKAELWQIEPVEPCN